MKVHTRFLKTSAIVAGAITITLVIVAGHFYLNAQDKSGFPDGYDAVQAAPNSHRVIFENAFVRVLEVTMPAPGQTEPMHHHRWPSFFLDWDTGGPSPHIRYHRSDGTVVDQPSQPSPKHPGHWTVHWMRPEPLHGIETVELPETQPDEPGIIRVELKFKP
jgi:hypothetical protein